jgi:Outer membrane protein beta-barrel domain
MDLTIPLLFTYSTNGVVRFYVNGGAYLGFLLSNNTIISAYGNYPEHVPSEQKNDVSEDTKTFDFGVRDNLGMMDTFKPENDLKARFNSFGFVFGLKYQL